MEQFKIREDGFKEIRKATFTRVVLIMLLALGGGIAISYFNTNAQPGDVNVLPFVIPVLLLLGLFGINKGIKRQKIIFDSYVLIIGNQSITREQYDTPAITIANADVTEIKKHPNGSFVIKGNAAVNLIGVPAQIEDPEKLELLLSGIRPISVKTEKTVLQKFSMLLPVATLGMMAAVYLSTNRMVVGVSGTVLLVLLGYSFFEVRRSKNVDAKTKRGMWWLIPVTASIIGVMYFKLTGGLAGY